jgi:hypothetical protein
MTIPCDECNSTGLIFFGDNDNFDTETCSCDFGMEQDFFLFNTPEAN